MSVLQRLQALTQRKWPDRLPGVLTLLGGGLYLALALVYAHTTVSNLDEGSYLYKGYLFVSGSYRPFQEYGPLTNKAPLAFLIPGVVQYLFGPGILVGRYFSVLLGLLTVLGTWIAARRVVGAWWAAAAVWIFALSPMIVKVHAIAVSEVIIACMLAWILVWTLGEDRPDWQLMLASSLASIAILTRQNMVLILPFLLGYIFWRYGFRSGIKSSVAGALVFLAGHVIFWPGILTMWLPWLPSGVTPFLDQFRSSAGGTPNWNPSIDLTNRIIAFFQGIRHHLVILMGGFVCALLWLFSRDKKKHARLPEMAFLGISYFSLMVLHAWAAVGSDYDAYSCVYCFSPYLAFFDPLGILLIGVCLAGLKDCSLSTTWNAASILLVLIVSAGVGLSLFQDVDVNILNLPVPRVSDGALLPGATTLREMLINKFTLTTGVLKKYTAVSLGLSGGALLLGLVGWLRSRRAGFPNYAYTVLTVSVISAFVLTPVLAGSEARLDCTYDIIGAYEQLGAAMDEVIPPDSLVYWDGGLSVVPLLYVRDIRIFTPQLNDGYSFRIGGDPDRLYRRSLWNEELRQAWMQSANVFIIEQSRYNNWKEFLSPAVFQEYERSAVSPSCKKGGELRIFSRID
jgi:hypothetical protein